MVMDYKVLTMCFQGLEQKGVNSHSYSSVDLDRFKGVSFSLMDMHFLNISCSVLRLFLMMIFLYLKY